MPEPKTSPRKNSAAPGKRNDEGKKLKEKIKRRIISRFGKRTYKSETTMLAEKISDAVVHRLSMLSASSMGEYPEPVPSVSQLCLRSGPLKNAGSKKKIIVNAVPKDFVDQNRWDAQRLRRKRSLEKQSISSDWPPVSNKAVDEETSSMWELADEMFSSAFRCGSPQCGERNFQWNISIFLHVCMLKRNWKRQSNGNSKYGRYKGGNKSNRAGRGSRGTRTRGRTRAAASIASVEIGSGRAHLLCKKCKAGGRVGSEYLGHRGMCPYEQLVVVLSSSGRDEDKKMAASAHRRAHRAIGAGTVQLVTDFIGIMIIKISRVWRLIIIWRLRGRQSAS